MVRDKNVWFAHETCGNVVQFSWLNFRQAAQLKPLANRILRNFHHVPNSLSEYAGHSNFEPGLFWCILHCPAVFSYVHLFQSMAKKCWEGPWRSWWTSNLTTCGNWDFLKKCGISWFFSPSGPSDSAMSCRCLQAVVQIEKRFQSRLRRRRALLEARDTCSQRFEISAGIRWYQMVSGVGHLHISRHISTYLDISRHSLTSRHISTYLDISRHSLTPWHILTYLDISRQCCR